MRGRVVFCPGEADHTVRSLEERSSTLVESPMIIVVLTANTTIP